MVLDKQWIVEANRDSLFTLSLALGSVRSGSCHNGLDLKWAYTGGLVLNRVFGARFLPEDAAHRVADVTSMVRSWQASALWMLDSTGSPEDLDAHLERNGWARRPSWVGMSMPSDQEVPEVTIPEGLTISGVTDQASLRTWARIRSGSACPHLIDAISDVFCELGYGDHLPWQFYTGFLEGKPVARSMTFAGGGVVGLYWIATDLEFRGRGIGTALTRHALVEAAKTGYDLIVLQATDLGAPIYRRLGFADDCRFDIFGFSPQQ